MSHASAAPIDPTDVALTTVAAQPQGSSPRAIVAWCVGASLLLISSGVVRAVQSGRYELDRNSQVECPFPLKELPRKVGDWHVVEGSETILDPLTTRITGSTDYVIWKYVNEMTGPALSVLVLYGPAEPVVPHTPQVCYPATGHRAVGGPVDKPIKIGEHEVATFRSAVFLKSVGREMAQSVVYHSFLLDGIWSPTIANRKFPRKSPGIFKIQIQRRGMPNEQSEGDNEPIERFLQEFLPVVEKKIAAATPPPSAPSSVATR